VDPTLCEGIVGDDGDEVKGENIIASAFQGVSKKRFPQPGINGD
jgi:hypothetical protein